MDMPYTQTIILHITLPDDQPNPKSWEWDAELDLHLVDAISDNEFVLEDWLLVDQNESDE
jgi:hypothetical protein